MLKLAILFLNLVIIFPNFSLVVSKEQLKPLKQSQPSYEKIIHFDKNDYHLRDIPDGYEGPVAGVQGLYAGDRYLTVWDNQNVFVFDIKSYTKLATLSPPLSIDDIVEKDGILYCLVNSSRTDNRIYVYDTFDSFKEYIFLSQFNNLAEYKNFRDEFKKDKKADRSRISHARTFLAAGLGHRKNIRTLDISEGKVFVNIDYNFLNFDLDFNLEKENEKFYMFLKHDIQKKEIESRPFLLNGILLSSIRSKQVNNSVKIEFIFNDIEFNFRKKEELILESNENLGEIVDNTPLAIFNESIIFRCGRAFFNKNTDKSYILIFKYKTNETITIELPDIVKNLGIVTNYFQYSSFSNSTVYLISYNSDLSFDVVKVEVKQ